MKIKLESKGVFTEPNYLLNIKLLPDNEDTKPEQVYECNMALADPTTLRVIMNMEIAINGLLAQIDFQQSHKTLWQRICELFR